METLMEQKLTKAQALMVIEYFAQQAAEAAPVNDVLYERHLWMTMYEVSLAVGRFIRRTDWETLVEAQIELQSFDRDPDAYIFQKGYAGNVHVASWDEYLKEQVSWGIDNVLRNSGA